MSIIINNESPYIEAISNSIFKEVLDRYEKCQLLILVDENTKPFIKLINKNVPILKSAFVVEIKSGEENKTLTTALTIWELLSTNNIRRNALLINLGGGVITDLGGFIASTYKRGINFINIPTTLLSMVDASVGGKTGIDLNNYKNQIGTFSEPIAVFCDKNFLKTLPENELVSGFAEVLKHGLIKDEKYWEYCTKNNFPNLEWEKVIEGSIAIKKAIVKNDPTEKGERKLLNFGHTIGHAIETYRMNHNKPILHGEAVAAGIICESYISTKKMQTSLSSQDFANITKSISAIFSKIQMDKNCFEELFELMKNDKKNDSQEINFTLLNGIGEGIFNQPCEKELIKEAIDFYISQ